MKMNDKKYPLVSVVMPVYNAGRYLSESIKSILNQTYRHFEFIIVDDASTDNSWHILKQYKNIDSRIRIYRNTKNLGVSQTVKKAIEKSTGDYIARMDADDIALPHRLKKQIDYLKKHPRTVAVGGQCIVINKDGDTVGEKTFPRSFEDVYRYAFTFIPVQQPTLTIARRRLPKDFQYYRDGMNTAEEVELIFKLFKFGNVENLPDRIHLYRMHGGNLSMKNIKYTYFLTLFSRLQAIFQYGYRPLFQDILVNIAQLLVVSLLPQRAIFSLYHYVRRIKTAREKMVRLRMAYNM